MLLINIVKDREVARHLLHSHALLGLRGDHANGPPPKARRPLVQDVVAQESVRRCAVGRQGICQPFWRCNWLETFRGHSAAVLAKREEVRRSGEKERLIGLGNGLRQGNWNLRALLSNRGRVGEELFFLVFML